MGGGGEGDYYHKGVEKEKKSEKRHISRYPTVAIKSKRSHRGVRSVNTKGE